MRISRMKGRINMLREFSVPLLGGVLVSLVWANIAPDQYGRVIHGSVFRSVSIHFVANDLFLVAFFAIAAVEISRAFLPGGALYPLKRAVNPLIATAGGVIGPALLYLALNRLLGGPELQRGWGVPTATDIAFAWMAARRVFGNGHPAVAFLLLLAVADDGIGLAIIALFYTDPRAAVDPRWLLLLLAGMAAAFALMRLRTKSYWPYVIAGGIPAWAGLHLAHVHPALALVFVVPFMPHAGRGAGELFGENGADRSAMAVFEQQWRPVVDVGLFLFGVANAGVAFATAGAATWLVLTSLLLGKTVGICLFGALADAAGYPLPQGVGKRELFIVGILGGFGFTVALFVAGEAFIDPAVQGAAKMGALLSCSAAGIAAVAGKVLAVGRHAPHRVGGH